MQSTSPCISTTRYREVADLAMVAANRSVELSPSPSATAVAQLDRLLDDAGSAYQVHTGRPPR